MRLKNILALSLGTATLGSGLAGIVVACGSSSPKPAEPQENRAEEAVAAYGKGSGFAEPPSEAPIEGYKPWSGPIFTSLDGTTTYTQAEVDGFELGTSFKAVWTAEIADGYSGKPYTYTKTFAVKDNAPFQENMVDAEIGKYVKAQTGPVAQPGEPGPGFSGWSGPVYKSEDNATVYTIGQINGLAPGTKVNAVYTATLSENYAGRPHTYTKTFVIWGVANGQSVTEEGEATYFKGSPPPDDQPDALAAGYKGWSAPVYKVQNEETPYASGQVERLELGAFFRVVYTAELAPYYEGAPYTQTKVYKVLGKASEQTDVTDPEKGVYLKGNNTAPEGEPGAVKEGYTPWQGPVYETSDGNAELTLEQIEALDLGTTFRAVYTNGVAANYDGTPYTYTKNFTVKRKASEQANFNDPTEGAYFRGSEPPSGAPGAAGEGYDSWVGPVYVDAGDQTVSYTAAQLDTLPFGSRFKAVYTANLSENYVGPATHTYAKVFVVTREMAATYENRVDTQEGQYVKGRGDPLPVADPGPVQRGYDPWTGPVYTSQDGMTTYPDAAAVDRLTPGTKIQIVYTASVNENFQGGKAYTYAKTCRVMGVAPPQNDIFSPGEGESDLVAYFYTPDPNDPEYAATFFPPRVEGYDAWDNLRLGGPRTYETTKSADGKHIYTSEEFESLKKDDKYRRVWIAKVNENYVGTPYYFEKVYKIVAR